jgi:hypothetical protein
MLEILLIVGSEGSFDVITGQHFGLRAKLRNQFGGCTEGGLAQAATFSTPIALGSLNKG